MRGPRKFEEAAVALLDTSALMGKRAMPEVVDCRECPDTFTGPTRWNDYARHLGDAHPQTIPSPRPRRPDEPVVIEKPAAIAGGEEAPVMASDDEICPVPGCGKKARHGARHRNQGVKGNGGGPALAATSVETANPIRDWAAGDENLEALIIRASTAHDALDRFGWHLEGCPSYDAATGDGPASQVDDPATRCTCGFRAALEEASAS